MATSRKSCIWNFYSICATDESKAICATCKERISRGGKSAKTYTTTNLKKHLHSRHQTQFKEFEQQEEAKAASEEASKQSGSGQGRASRRQVSLDLLVAKHQPFGFDHPKSREINRLVGELIAVDNQPFSIVDDIGFTRLIHHLEPRYKLPSRRYFSETLIPSVYDKLKLLVAELVQAQQYVSCTTDIWSSPVHDSLLSLTAHFITKEFERKQVCLQAVKFNDSHTGSNIASMINSCIQAWKLTEKLTCIIRDNAANYVAGLRDADIPNFGCLAHTLQLVINDGVLVQRGVQELLGAARKLVGHYKHSNVSFQTLKQMQAQLGVPQHSLIQDEPTRWNSSFYMLQRLIEQRTALLAAGAACACMIELRAQQWNLAEKLVHVLQPFEEATREASGEYSSAAVIIPVVNSLQRSLTTTAESTTDDHGITRMKQEMLSSLNRRYQHMETNKLYALATALDPRFKLCVFASASASASVRQMLMEEYEQLAEIEDSPIPPEKQPRTATESGNGENASTSKSMLWTYFDEIVKEHNSDGPASTPTVEAVVDAYLHEPVCSRKSSPLDYWKQKQSLWPLLATMARKYLSIPPSSVPSERLFSTAGEVMSDRRNRLAPEKVEMLLFLNKNLKIFDFKY